MRRTRSRWTVIFGVAALLVCGLVGCTNNVAKGHKEASQAANKRWLSQRSALMIQMAQQQFDSGDLDRCEKTLVEAVAVDASNPRLHLLAGRVALERGQLERAFNRLQAASELDDKMPEPHYYAGIVLQRWQQLEPALAAYQKAYELHPDHVPYLLAIAEVLGSLSRLDEALALLESKRTYFDTSSSLREALGQLYTVRNQHDNAAAMFKEASVLRPEDLSLIEDLALARIAAEQYEQAIEPLERLLRDTKYADRIDLEKDLAFCNEKTARLAAAREIYLKISRKTPKDVDVWAQLGHLCWEQQDLSGALLASSRMTTLAPQSVDGYLLAGMVAQKRGQWDEALRLFDQAALLAPQSAEPVLMRGLTLEKAGRNSAAVAAYQEATRRQPEDPRAATLMARLSESSKH